jgi:Fur family transcriptional regulator, peroxide stress response regulator
MQTEISKNLNEKLVGFRERCRQTKLKITPQRMAIYKALVQTDTHPTAEDIHRLVRSELSSISFDTVNRTLLTLAEVGAAFVVEGSGQARRFDGGMEAHQHFRCLKCGRIIDFYYAPYDSIALPDFLSAYKVTRKTVYLEGYCEECNNNQ